MNPGSKENKESIFIDENRNVFRGDQAVELLRARPPETVDPVKGVTRVEAERWQEAQRYERRTWMEGVAAMSDRNEAHQAYFGGYSALAGKHFRSAIELGCGPFTNLRKILIHCKVDEIHLLDPLASDYLEHPFCRYKKRRLGGIFKTSLLPWTRRGGFKHPLRFYKHKCDEWRVGKGFGREIALHTQAIEDFVTSGRFDLCVMINVIEHCRDADLIFSKILEMTGPGSYFVFADKIYSASREAEEASSRFDAGHPLRVDHTVVRAFLGENFHALWDSEVVEREGGEEFKSNYFIGVRR